MDIESLKKKYKDNTAQAKVVELEEQMKKGFESGDRNVGDIGADLAYYSELSLKTSDIQKALSDLENTKEMVKNEQDLELKEMASEEIVNLEEKIGILDNEIKKLLISRKFVDENDNRSAILEIRAGAGGDEAALFAADLFRMYKNYATANGWK